MKRHELPRHEVQQVNLPCPFALSPACYFCIQLSLCFRFSGCHQVICSLCDTEQEVCVLTFATNLWHAKHIAFIWLYHHAAFCCQVRQVCINCGVCMGKYFCGSCKLFDDDVSKRKLAVVYYFLLNVDVKMPHLKIFCLCL